MDSTRKTPKRPVSECDACLNKFDVCDASPFCVTPFQLRDLNIVYSSLFKLSFKYFITFRIVFLLSFMGFHSNAAKGKVTGVYSQILNENAYYVNISMKGNEKTKIVSNFL